MYYRRCMYNSGQSSGVFGISMYTCTECKMINNNGFLRMDWYIRTACQTSDVLDCVPGCGLNDGGADDNAESLSEPDESCQYK